MENIYTIYKATNKINYDGYCGFDSNSPSRMYIHIWLVQHNQGHYFHNAIRKYGLDNFNWEILYQSLNGEYTLKTMETYFINEYNTFYLNGHGYNMTFGGDGILGCKRSEETKKKLSLIHKGKIPWNKGLRTEPQKQEHILKAAQARKGKRRKPYKNRIEYTKAAQKYWTKSNLSINK